MTAHIRFELRPSYSSKYQRRNQRTPAKASKSNRYTLWVFGATKPHPKFNFNKTLIAGRLADIVAFIDTHKGDNRDALAIIAETGLAKLMLETELMPEDRTP